MVGCPLFHFSLLFINVISSSELIELSKVDTYQFSLLLFSCRKTELKKKKEKTINNLELLLEADYYFYAVHFFERQPVLLVF